MKAFIFLYKVSALADNSNIELPLNELDRPLLANVGSLVTKNGKKKISQMDLMEMTCDPLDQQAKTTTLTIAL